MIRVSDHALARLIERHLGTTRDELVRQLLPAHLLEKVHVAGGTCTLVHDERQWIFEDYVLKTVLHEWMDSGMSRKQKALFANTKKHIRRSEARAEVRRKRNRDTPELDHE